MSVKAHQRLWGLMMGEDQGGLSLGLPEKPLRLGLVLEQRPGPGTTSVSPEIDWQLKVGQIQIRQPHRCVRVSCVGLNGIQTPVMVYQIASDHINNLPFYREKRKTLQRPRVTMTLGVITTEEKVVCEVRQLIKYLIMSLIIKTLQVDG